MARSAADIPAGDGGNKFNKEVLKPNGYPARLVGAVFVGEQNQRPYMGEAKPPVQEVRLTYELSHAFMKGEDGEDLTDKPRWQSETVAFKSLKLDRAKFTKRYNVFDPAHTNKGVIANCLGLPCTVVVTNNAGKGKHAGKVFENIGDVTAVADFPGYVQPELVNDTFYYDPFDEECTLEQFRAQPEFLQGIIMGANDYAHSHLAKLIGGAPEPKVEQRAAPEAPEADNDDENPY